MLQEPKSAEWPWDSGESTTALGKLGWGKKSQVLIWLWVRVRKKEEDSIDESVTGWKYESTFRGVRVPPPFCSPRVFDKFDIPLLSTGVPNASRNICRHLPPDIIKVTLFSLFLGPSYGKFSAVCLKKILELCMIHSASNYWHVILPSFQHRGDFFSVLISFSYFILPVLIRAWVELCIWEFYDWCSSLQQRPGLQSGFVLEIAPSLHY